MLPQQLPVQPQKNPPNQKPPRAVSPEAACVPDHSRGQHMLPQQLPDTLSCTAPATASDSGAQGRARHFLPIATGSADDSSHFAPQKNGFNAGRSKPTLHRKTCRSKPRHGKPSAEFKMQNVSLASTPEHTVFTPPPPAPSPPEAPGKRHPAQSPQNPPSPSPRTGRPSRQTLRNPPCSRRKPSDPHPR